MKNYDIAVIGAGITGVCSAWFLKKSGMRVLLIDKSSAIASGGSGAAGAFISPKIGKISKLHTLTNESFKFAINFYQTHFPKHFYQTGILRVPKDRDDTKKFDIYEEFNYKPYERWDRDRLKEYKIDEDVGFFFPEAGDCDAQELCQEISKDIDFLQLHIKSITRSSNAWILSSDSRDIEIPKVVLCTGYENSLLDMRYMGIKGLWGSRGDYSSEYKLDITIHKDFTLSSNRDGVLKIGATHIKSPTPCLVCDGKPLAELETKAKSLIKDIDIKPMQILCGMRSTSRDHSPVVGRIIDTNSMLNSYPNITKGAKAPLIYLPDIYILNGVGGRGFVLSPMMADILSQFITKGIDIPDSVNADRLFFKWVRRVKID